MHVKCLLIALIFVVTAGAKFPVPIFPDVSFPLPVWTADTVTVVAEEAIIRHSAKPTVRPMRVPHGRNSNLHRCLCESMCGGQHLVNGHGMTNDEWNREKLWRSQSRLLAYHNRLHVKQPKPRVQPQQCCPDGNCGGGRLFGRLRGRWR